MYKFAEKYYDWFHTSTYPLLNNTIKDWNELYLEKLIDKCDRPIKGRVSEENYNDLSTFLIYKNNNFSSLTYLDLRKELFNHPYPIMSIKENNYYLIQNNFDRWRNSWDYYLIKDLYYYADFKEWNKILTQQEFINNLMKNNYVIRT